MIAEQRAGLSLVTQLVTRSEAEDPAALQVFQRFSRRALASLTENEDALDQGPHGLLKFHSFATPQTPCHGSCVCVSGRTARCCLVIPPRPHVTDLAFACSAWPRRSSPARLYRSSL